MTTTDFYNLQTFKPFANTCSRGLQPRSSAINPVDPKWFLSLTYCLLSITRKWVPARNNTGPTRLCRLDYTKATVNLHVLESNETRPHLTNVLERTPPKQDSLCSTPMRAEPLSCANLARNVRISGLSCSERALRRLRR